MSGHIWLSPKSNRKAPWRPQEYEAFCEELGEAYDELLCWCESKAHFEIHLGTWDWVEEQVLAQLPRRLFSRRRSTILGAEALARSLVEEGAVRLRERGYEINRDQTVLAVTNDVLRILWTENLRRVRYDPAEIQQTLKECGAIVLPSVEKRSGEDACGGRRHWMTTTAYSV